MYHIICTVSCRYRAGNIPVSSAKLVNIRMKWDKEGLQIHILLPVQGRFCCQISLASMLFKKRTNFDFLVSFSEHFRVSELQARDGELM